MGSKSEHRAGGLDSSPIVHGLAKRDCEPFKSQKSIGGSSRVSMQVNFAIHTQAHPPAFDNLWIVMPHDKRVCSNRIRRQIRGLVADHATVT